MRKLTKFAVAAAVALAGGTAAIAMVPVWADEGSSGSSSGSSAMTSMTISPMHQEIILTPGETYKGTIKVTNSAGSPGPLKYSVKVGSFSTRADANSKDDYGVVDTQAVSSYNQMMNWVKIEAETGEVAPNDTQVVNFTIDVPADAPAGGQYATLLFQNDTDDEEQSGNVNIQSKFQVASIIYAEVAGTTRNEGQILENSVPGFLLSGPLRTTSMIENDGNVHTNANYVLQVWPLFSDEEICTNEEKPTESLVMPETKQFHTESCNLGVVGIYRARQTVTIFGETSVVEATVFLCPIWLILVILVAILAIVIYFVRKARARKGKFEKQDPKGKVDFK